MYFLYLKFRFENDNAADLFFNVNQKYVAGN